MTNFFEKHELLVCMLLIIIYIVSNSYCMQNFGVEDYRTVVVNTIITIGLLTLIITLKGIKYYGLTKPENSKKFLYFSPLILMASVNLWNGININNSKNEILFHILTMVNVGFIEEIIFRGFLFRMMEKTNVKSAMIVSAITFGVGHIINLLNGAELIPTLIQVCYATSIVFLFVIIFYKSKSLIPCIITHCIVNSLSIFNIESTISIYIAPIILTIVPIIYTIYINKTIKE